MTAKTWKFRRSSLRMSDAMDTECTNRKRSKGVVFWSIFHFFFSSISSTLSHDGIRGARSRFTEFKCSWRLRIVAFLCPTKFSVPLRRQPELRCRRFIRRLFIRLTCALVLSSLHTLDSIIHSSNEWIYMERKGGKYTKHRANGKYEIIPHYSEIRVLMRRLLLLPRTSGLVSVWFIRRSCRFGCLFLPRFEFRIRMGRCTLPQAFGNHTEEKRSRRRRLCGSVME